MIFGFEEKYPKIWLWFSGLLVLIILGWIGYQNSGLPELRYLARAESFMEKGDDNRAMLILRKLIQRDPENYAAFEMSGEILYQSGSTACLVPFQKALSLKPDNLSLRFKLAASAIRFGNFDMAEKLLMEVPREETNSVNYLKLNGLIARRNGDLDLARDQFNRVLVLNPADVEGRFNYASLLLQASEPENRKTAVAMLESMLDQPERRLEILMMLLPHAARNADRDQVKDYAQEILDVPGLSFASYLFVMEHLVAVFPDKIEDVIDEGLIWAKGNVGDVYRLLVWLNDHGRMQDVLRSRETFSRSMTAMLPISMAFVEAYILTEQWERLREFLVLCDWGQLGFLKNILNNKIEQKAGARSISSLDTAALSLGLKANPIVSDILNRFAAKCLKWGWVQEAETIWWVNARSSERPIPALMNLFSLFRALKNTQGLLEVSELTLKKAPNDAVAANNRALFMLLLDKDPALALIKAEALYEAYADKPPIATTYAFALVRNGEHERALKTIQSMPEEWLEIPQVSFYTGVIMGLTGQTNQALIHFENRPADKDLLPEELNWMNAALQGTGAK